MVLPQQFSAALCPEERQSIPPPLQVQQAAGGLQELLCESLNKKGVMPHCLNNPEGGADPTEPVTEAAARAAAQELLCESLNNDSCSLSMRAAALKLHPLRRRGLWGSPLTCQGSGVTRRLLLEGWVGPMHCGVAATGCWRPEVTDGGPPRASSSTRLTRRRPAEGPCKERGDFPRKQQQHSLLSILQPLPEVSRGAGLDAAVPRCMARLLRKRRRAYVARR
jgi:hypothetical protein